MRLIVLLTAMLAALGGLIGWLVYSRSTAVAPEQANVRRDTDPGASVGRRPGVARSERRGSTGGPSGHTAEAAPTAESERDQRVAGLVDSGVAPPEFLTAMKAVDSEFRALAADPALDATVSEWRCYRAGCVTNLAHKDVVSVELLARRFQSSKAFSGWAGGKFRSGPIPRTDGRLEITWIFERPEGTTELVQ